MIQKAFISSLFFIFILSGCSTMSSPDASYEKEGTVENRVLSIKEGGGESLGGMIGSIAGSFAGNDALSSAVGALVGGITGSYIGKEVSRYDSSKLSIGLDDGNSVMVNTKDLSIETGDRVIVIKEANQFPSVKKIAY